jgi:Fibronectin type III domain
MNRKLVLLFLALFAFVCLAPTMVLAAPKLVWDPSSGVVTGYRIYFGQSQGSHPNSKDVGNVTQYLLSDLALQEKNTYYFVARAYNGVGESGDSNEVSWLVPDKTPPLPPQGVTAQ